MKGFRCERYVKVATSEDICVVLDETSSRNRPLITQFYSWTELDRPLISRLPV